MGDDHDPWSQLTFISNAEQHFNEIESKYRALASTWLLASFGGMGFIIESTSLPVQREILVLLIAVAGSIGIQLIWIIDLLAYHGLLQSYFVEGLRLEVENQHLPQVRWNMLDYTKSVEEKVRIFYAACSLVLLLFGVFVLIIGFSNMSSSISSGLILILSFSVISTIILWKRTRHPGIIERVNKLRTERDELAK